MKVKKPKMTDTARIALIREVMETCMRETESFVGDELGMELAYLFGAVAKARDAECVEWSKDSHEYHLDLFRTLFPADHLVWQFIEIIDD